MNKLATRVGRTWSDLAGDLDPENEPGWTADEAFAWMNDSEEIEATFSVALVALLERSPMADRYLFVDVMRGAARNRWTEIA